MYKSLQLLPVDLRHVDHVFFFSGMTIAFVHLVMCVCVFFFLVMCSLFVQA